MYYDIYVLVLLGPGLTGPGLFEAPLVPLGPGPFREQSFYGPGPFWAPARRTSKNLSPHRCKSIGGVAKPAAKPAEPSEPAEPSVHHSPKINSPPPGPLHPNAFQAFLHILAC
jgi:hypothetical protein